MKKLVSLCLVLAMLVVPVAPIKAQEEKIVVYVAAQGKSSDGTKTVTIKKTPVQVAEGTMADAVIKTVLDQSDYADQYEIQESSYGPFLESINGMGTELVDPDTYQYNYWSFYINGDYLTTGMGTTLLSDGDQISLIYSYDDTSMEVADYVDNETLNPDETANAKAIETAKKNNQIIAKAVYDKYFADGHIPGLGSINEVYAAFSLARSGFEAPEFYGKVKSKLLRQFKELKEKGTTYDAVTKTDITEASIKDEGYAELFYAKAVLALGALGADAKDAGGFDLIEKMASKEIYEASNKYTREATMLLAFDSKNYALPVGEDYLTRDEIVTALSNDIDNQIATSISWGSLDSIAMAVQPLANYVDDEVVKKSSEKAFSFIQKMQSVNGYFGDEWTPNNPWTLAQVMTAAAQFSQNPLTEETGDYIKNGKTVLDGAAEFVAADGTISAYLLSFQPEQLLRGLSDVIYTCTQSDEKVYQIQSTVNVIDPTEPFEEEKPQVTPTPLPTQAPTTQPTVAPSVQPTLAPIVSPTVVVKNPVTKLSLSKKKVTIKKGKSFKVTVKTKTAYKKKTTDKVSVKGKKVALKKVKKATGKVTLTLVASKKGKQKLTICVGKKSIKITLKVK